MHDYTWKHIATEKFVCLFSIIKGWAQVLWIEQHTNSFKTVSLNFGSMSWQVIKVPRVGSNLQSFYLSLRKVYYLLSAWF